MKSWQARISIGFLAVALMTAPAAMAITAEEVEEAQATWGAGVVAIGAAYSDDGDYEAVAREHVETLYAFQMGDVLFKPTKAVEDQFRTTEEEAVSYFVGGNDDHPEDGGFALQPWTDVRFENEALYLTDDYAVAMGNYYFTPAEGGDPVKVEYTFGYMKDEEGNLRINLHHSSVPFPG